jgi:hypothetical protein
MSAKCGLRELEVELELHLYLPRTVNGFVGDASPLRVKHA